MPKYTRVPRIGGRARNPGFRAGAIVRGGVGDTQTGSFRVLLYTDTRGAQRRRCVVVAGS
jgi:hypothetical protein